MKQQDNSIAEIVAVYLTSLSFDGMAKECLAGTYPPNRFVGLVLRESEKKLDAAGYASLRGCFQKLGLIHF